MKDSIYSKSGKKAGILSVLCNKSLQTYVRVCTYGLCMHTLQQEWLSHQLSQDSMVLVQDLSCSFPLCGASEIISYVLPNSSNWKITFTYATVASNVQAIPTSVVP